MSAPAPAAASSSASTSSLTKPSQPYSCIVLGASGATGRVLVGKLANNPIVTHINAIVRTELPAGYFGQLLPANQEKIKQTVVDFENLKASADAFKGYSVAFSCLGSTRSKAGSKEAFYHQDYDYITEAARLVREAGVEHFALTSSSGADHKSMFHYLKTKGLIEQHLINTVRFPSLSIFRPGLLLTDRPNESRWGEWFAQKIVPAFHAILPEKACGVYTQTVAESMMRNAEVMLAQKEKTGSFAPPASAPAAAAEGAVEGDAAPAEPAAAPAPSASSWRIFENDEIRAMKVAKL